MNAWHSPSSPSLLSAAASSPSSSSPSSPTPKAPPQRPKGNSYRAFQNGSIQAQQYGGVSRCQLTAWFRLYHSLQSHPHVQSGGYFGKEASFRFKFHCLLRNRVLSLSKNRSPEFIFLLQGWAGLASCLDTHGRTPHPGSHFSTSSVLCPQSSSGGWAPPQPLSPQGLLPEEEVPSPAQRHEAPGNTGGLCSPSPLATTGLPGRKCLF